MNLAKEMALDMELLVCKGGEWKWKIPTVPSPTCLVILKVQTSSINFLKNYSLISECDFVLETSAFILLNYHNPKSLTKSVSKLWHFRLVVFCCF